MSRRSYHSLSTAYIEKHDPNLPPRPKHTAKINFQPRFGPKYKKRFLRMKNAFTGDYFPEKRITVLPKKKVEYCRKALEKILVKDIVDLICPMITKEKYTSELLEENFSKETVYENLFQTNYSGIVLGLFFRRKPVDGEKYKIVEYQGEKLYYHRLKTPMMNYHLDSYLEEKFCADLYFVKKFAPFSKIFDYGKNFFLHSQNLRCKRQIVNGERFYFY